MTLPSAARPGCGGHRMIVGIVVDRRSRPSRALALRRRAPGWAPANASFLRRRRAHERSAPTDQRGARPRRAGTWRRAAGRMPPPFEVAEPQSRRCRARSRRCCWSGGRDSLHSIRAPLRCAARTVIARTPGPPLSAADRGSSSSFARVLSKRRYALPAEELQPRPGRCSATTTELAAPAPRVSVTVVGPRADARI